MSSNPGATAPLPEELGKPLEDSLTHLVNNSQAHKGAQKDQLARMVSNRVRCADSGSE